MEGQLRKLEEELADSKDITEIQALKQRVADLENFIEEANIPMHWVGPDGTILWANQAELDYMGYSREEFVGRHIAEFHADKPTIDSILSRLNANEKLQAHPARLRTKSGEIKHVEIYSSVRFDEGEFIHTRCFTYDVTEQKNTLYALKQSESRYSQLIDNLPAAVYICNAEGYITLYNKAAAELWGREPVIGKDLWCGSWRIYWSTGDEMTLDQCPMAIALKEGRSVYGKEIIIEKPDGSKRNVIPHPSPIYNSKGEVIEAVNMLVDITDLRTAENAMRKSEKEFRQLADFVPQIVWTATAEGYTNYFNKQWYNYTGLDESLHGDEIWTGVLHPEDVDRCIDTWYSSVRNGVPYQIEYRFRDFNRNGEYRWFLGRALPIRDDQGNITKWFGTCTDIHEQKLLLEKLGEMGELLEKKVAERTSQLEEAQALAHIGSWEWEIGSDKVIFSKEQCRIYGLPETENTWSFKEFLDFRYSLDRKNIEKILKDAIKNCSDFAYECTILRAGGEERQLFARGTVHCNSQGEPERILATTQDITERKKYESELLQKNAELERSNAELENFAYVASHDLKEPLRMISSYIQLVDQKLPKDEVPLEIDEYMGFVHEGAVRMQRLIDDLLRYSRIGRMEPLNFVPTDMQELLESVCHSMEKRIEESGAQIIVESLPYVSGIRSQMSQLFQNLIENAIKFKREDSPIIHIKGSEKNGMILFSVADNGIGIHPDYYKKIFQLFQRLHTADKYPGTGIGLSICKKIVDLHSGEIWIESELGKGTTFFFTLPKSGE